MQKAAKGKKAADVESYYQLSIYGFGLSGCRHRSICLDEMAECYNIRADCYTVRRARIFQQVALEVSGLHAAIAAICSLRALCTEMRGIIVSLRSAMATTAKGFS